ncbi:Fur family transcriptional regulator [Dehalogenimonas sp. 4OHTPN]|uniref:Fur family transcriptional regulator n=1 Tax=Dehalogenimonas sp. 4OHTPN TaxID=3166643 RepID=A0AAU8GCM9_9CHLR
MPLGKTALKATGQRAVILDIIRAGKGHLDADEIYQRARKKLPRISLSTVYRALAKFKESGLVEERHLDQNHHHYEISHQEHHHHLICTDCGRVVEFSLPISEIVAAVTQAGGFLIRGGEISLTGLCPECQKKTV